MSALQTLQREFQDFVLDGRAEIVQRVVGTSSVDPARRLGVYYDAYRLRLIEALQTDYTSLKIVMGEDDFAQSMGAFVEATPSVHRNLRWYGQSLPEFLRTRAPSAEQPWLWELALFEWTIALAFDAADEPVLTFDDLAAMDSGIWPYLTFKFHPSRQRLSLRTNAASLRKAVDEEAPIPPPERLAQPIQWLLWRKDLTVMFRSLLPEEAWALDTAHAGGNFTELCEGLCQWVAPAAAAGRLAGMLRTWVDDQLIAAVGSPASVGCVLGTVAVHAHLIASGRGP